MAGENIVKWLQRKRQFWVKRMFFVCVGSILVVSTLLFIDTEPAHHWIPLSVFGPSKILEEVTLTDDPTCLSRTQQNMYRRELPMTRGMRETWKRYVKLHQSCSSNGERNWTHAFLNHEDSPCKYLIVMEGSAGLGNKILSLISALLYAVATDRIILLESRKVLPKLLCEPFAKSSWLLPVAFPYENVEQAPRMGKARELNWNVTLINLNLEHLQSEDDQQFFCYETQVKLREVRWLAWTSTQYYVTQLFMIPSFWSRLTPLFNSSVDAFTSLSRLVVLPSNELWAHIVRVYWAYLASSGLRVGLQVRLHGRWDPAVFDEQVNDRIMDCLTNHSILPKVQMSEELERMSDLYTKKLKALNGQDAPVDIAVLVTSLQAKYQERLTELFDRHSNFENMTVRVHMVSHFGRQEDSEEQAHVALVELWLLSFSDVLVTSAYSTFGYVAQGMGDLTPYILNIRGENIGADGKLSCEVGQSSQPCTHFPMHPTCLPVNTSLQHQLWIDEHVRECQDQPGGLQLGLYAAVNEG